MEFYSCSLSKICKASLSTGTICQDKTWPVALKVFSEKDQVCYPSVKQKEFQCLKKNPGHMESVNITPAGWLWRKAWVP